MEPYMQEAMQELKRISQDEKIIGLYDAEKVEEKIRNTQMKSARMEGMEEGKIQSQIEIAHNLLKIGIPINQISEATSLSIFEIEKCKEEM